MLNNFNFNVHLHMGQKNVSTDDPVVKELSMNDLLDKTVDAVYEIVYDTSKQSLNVVMQHDTPKFGQKPSFEFHILKETSRSDAHVHIMKHALESNFNRVCIVNCKLKDTRAVKEQEIKDIVHFLESQDKQTSCLQPLLVLSGHPNLDEPTVPLMEYNANLSYCGIHDASVFIIDANSMKTILPLIDNAFVRQHPISNIYANYMTSVCIFPRVAVPENSGLWTSAWFANIFRDNFDCSKSTIVHLTMLAVLVVVFIVVFIASFSK